MSHHHKLVVGWLISMLALACTAPATATDTTSDGGATDTNTDTKMAACDGSATLYKISVNEEAITLADGANLPVTRGFQGFLFVRVGLLSSLNLPQNIKLKARVQVPGEVDQVVVYATVRTETQPGGFRTTDVPIFFNDSPLAELVGRTATVEMWTRSPGCTLRAIATVKLSSGNYMSEDAAFWDADASP